MAHELKNGGKSEGARGRMAAAAMHIFIQIAIAHFFFLHILHGRSFSLFLSFALRFDGIK